MLLADNLESEKKNERRRIIIFLFVFLCFDYLFVARVSLLCMNYVSGRRKQRTTAEKKVHVQLSKKSLTRLGRHSVKSL